MKNLILSIRIVCLCCYSVSVGIVITAMIYGLPMPMPAAYSAIGFGLGYVLSSMAHYFPWLRSSLTPEHSQKGSQ